MILENTKKNRLMAAGILKNGGIGVMPSDTLYGIMGFARNSRVVEKIYRLRQRNKKKPLLVLISGPRELNNFGVKYTGFYKKIGKRFWPGSMTIVFPCGLKALEYLHRGTKTIAFRVPKPLWLRRFLEISGPLVAPSANYEGEATPGTISGARKYFKDKIDFYLDAGTLKGLPSTVVKVKNNGIIVLRQGRVRVPDELSKHD